MALTSLDLGSTMFYAIETLAIAGILILLFMAILTSMHFLLRGKRHKAIRSSPIFFLLSVALEIGLIAILWLLHDLTSSLIG